MVGVIQEISKNHPENCLRGFSKNVFPRLVLFTCNTDFFPVLGFFFSFLLNYSQVSAPETECRCSWNRKF